MAKSLENVRFQGFSLFILRGLWKIVKFFFKKVSIFRNFAYFCKEISSPKITDVQRFRTIFLEEVDEFFDELDDKVKAKILFNIDKAEQTNDPRLFKK